MIRPTSHGLLRGHVARRAHQRPTLGQALTRTHAPLRHDARDAKVAHKGVPLAVDQDVRGLDVAMHHPLAVRIVQGSSHLAQQVAHLVQRKPPPAQHVLERASLQVAHHDVRRVVGKVVDGKHVRVFQPGHHPRLALKARHRLWVLGDRLPDDLDGHKAVHTRLVGAVHRRHPSLADLFDDLVRAKLGADHRIPSSERRMRS